MSTDIIAIRYIATGYEEDMDASTPIYIESHSDATAARTDDGAMAHIDALVDAGTLGDPDGYVAGRTVADATWYVRTDAVEDGCCEAIELA